MTHYIIVVGFIYKKQKYIIIDNCELRVVSGLENESLESIISGSSGLFTSGYGERVDLFGENEITVQVPSIFEILCTEILNPFYVFQLFSIILWYYDEYHLYASSIVIITTISMATTTYQGTEKLNFRFGR